MKYVGHEVTVPGPGLLTPEDCQTQCRLTVYCKYFTYLAAGNASINQHAKTCMKFNDQATLVPVEGPANQTISGPVLCPPATAPGTTSAAPATSQAPANNTIVAPASSVPTPVTDASSVPTPVMDANGTSCVNGTCGVAGGTEEAEGGGGMHWWAIALVVVIVLAVLALVLYGLCAPEKEKKKKKAKKSKKMEATEVESLVLAEAPPPVAEATVPVAAPVQTAVPAAMMATGPQMAAPVYTSQGQVLQMQQPLAPGVQMMQMPVLSGGARQLQIR